MRFPSQYFEEDRKMECKPHLYGFLLYMGTGWVVLEIKAIDFINEDKEQGHHVMILLAKSLGMSNNVENYFSSKYERTARYFDRWHGWSQNDVKFYKTLDELHQKHLKDML